MRKPKFYWCEIYKVNVWYMLGWSPSDAKKFLAKYIPDTLDFSTSNGKTIDITNDEGDMIIVIWTRRRLDLASFVHECVHTSHIILDRAHVRADYNNDEAEAYLTQTIFTKGFAK